ncbi:MAG: precorrin-4 C(11)-methyltransferase [Bacillota bacterium]
MAKVYFVGAGPGDPELITVKGARLLREADVVVYAGSLVNPALLLNLRQDCLRCDSAKMTLAEVMAVMLPAARAGKTVVRLHSGDPSIYGAIREQLSVLEEHGVAYEIVPGVSSFTAAAASLGREYTLPGVSQTVILTRMEGRTPVPAGQEIGVLAAHGASMAIFLSVQLIEKVVDALLEGYAPDTPAAVVQRASWPQERIIRSTLADIAERVRAENIDRTALILVGDFLGDQFDLSRLYDGAFSHGFREAIE